MMMLFRRRKQQEAVNNFQTDSYVNILLFFSFSVAITLFAVFVIIPLWKQESWYVCVPSRKSEKNVMVRKRIALFL